jgi:hypothetical protein
MPITQMAAIGLGAACLLLGAAREPTQKAETSNTERMDFPSGGTLRLTNSTGVLTVEAWDRPDVEITTTKSAKSEYDASERHKVTRDLEAVHVRAEPRGEELVVTTELSRSQHFPSPSSLAGEINFDLEYHVSVPRDTRIVVNHTFGEVNVEGVAGDIDVTLLQGTITLHLPEEVRYNTNAKVDFGHVNSDFPGQQKRRRWLVGHRIVNEESGAAHRLNLRVGYGDIVILKTRMPKRPEPLILPARKEPPS